MPPSGVPADFPARTPAPDTEAPATLPLFLLLFAAAYHLLERARPGSFSERLTRTDALYFALSVFSTAGSGGIAPHSQAARTITMFQMAGDLLLVGVAARVVVGAVESGLRRREARDH